MNRRQARIVALLIARAAITKEIGNPSEITPSLEIMEYEYSKVLVELDEILQQIERKLKRTGYDGTLDTESGDNE